LTLDQNHPFGQVAFQSLLQKLEYRSASGDCERAEH